MANLQNYEGSLRDSKKLSGIYRARVEDNQDPLNIGRVKIRVPMIHGMPTSGISISGLPWATLCSSSAGYNYGSFIVPEIGEYVCVTFEDGDSSKPVCLGSMYGTGASKDKEYGIGDRAWTGVAGENEVPLEAQKSDPSRKIIYKSPKGSYIELEEEKDGESLVIADFRGQKIELDGNGISISNDDGCSITFGTEKSSKGKGRSVSKGISLNVNGATIDIDTTGKISVKGSGETIISTDSTVGIEAPAVNITGGVTIIE